MAPPSKPAAANGAGQEEAEASPVLAAVAKRMRNLRKRLRNAEEIQAKRDAGKELNPDQVGPCRCCPRSWAACTPNWAARWRCRRPQAPACPAPCPRGRLRTCRALIRSRACPCCRSWR